MFAVQINRHGDSSCLELVEAPIPQPGAGEVRIRIDAVGLNFVETYQRRGLYSIGLPFVPGSEFSGWVDAVGENAGRLKIGDRVATASGKGGYAQYALAPANRVAVIPENVSNQQAAALLLQGITAHYLAISTFPLNRGDIALIHAAAGGVGQILVQIAKTRGAVVIATASTAEKAMVVSDLGADYVIQYTRDDFEEKVKHITRGFGVDVVFDGVGKSTFEKGLNCLKVRGMMVLYGQSSGPVDPVDPQLLNRRGSLFLTRPSLEHYLRSDGEFSWRAGELFQWVEKGDLRIAIDRTFSLPEAAKAHDYIEARSTKGKVLLIP